MLIALYQIYHGEHDDQLLILLHLFWALKYSSYFKELLVHSYDQVLLRDSLRVRIQDSAIRDRNQDFRFRVPTANFQTIEPITFMFNFSQFTTLNDYLLLLIVNNCLTFMLNELHWLWFLTRIPGIVSGSAS